MDKFLGSCSVPDLTPVEKFYEEVTATLKKRFGGKQKIIDKHVDALSKVGAVTSCHKVQGLRHLYDHVCSHIRSLRSLAWSNI